MASTKATPDLDVGRVPRGKFLQLVATRTGLPLSTVRTAYAGILDEVVAQVSEGNTVLFTGFGKFYPQIHAGHKVRVGDGFRQIADYPTLKFSANREVNRMLEGLGAEKPVAPPIPRPHDRGFGRFEEVDDPE